MVRPMKLALACLVVIGLVAVVLPVLAEESTTATAPQITSVSGEVVSVDAAKSEVVVKQVKSDNASAYENTTVTVAPETKITKGDATLQLSDLKAGDKVTVKSSADASGKVTVESIAVEVVN